MIFSKRLLLRGWIVASFAFAALAPAPAQGQQTRWAEFSFVTEAGFVAPFYHTIQYGENADTFDYIDDGGQDTLFPALRVSAELTLRGKHTVVLLYQPLDLRTAVKLDDALAFDDVVFASGTPVDLRYGFDFYRISYLYDFLEDEDAELGLGLSLQVRNAVIVFSSANGEQRKSERDLGPVPEIKLRGRWLFPGGIWLGGELDGIWAPVKYFNGSDSGVEGAILDASVRVGYEIDDELDIFFNLRYLGGGAEGTGDDDYTENWLQFLTTTVGVIWTPTRS